MLLFICLIISLIIIRLDLSRGGLDRIPLRSLLFRPILARLYTRLTHGRHGGNNANRLAVELGGADALKVLD